MIESKPVYLVFIVTVLFILVTALVPGVLGESIVYAQDDPASGNADPHPARHTYCNP